MRSADINTNLINDTPPLGTGTAHTDCHSGAVAFNFKSFPFLGGNADGFLEVLAEEGLVGEMQFFGYLLDGIAAAAQHRFGLQDDIILYPF